MSSHATSGSYPPELIVLALAAEVGQEAGRLLRASGYPLPPSTGHPASRLGELSRLLQDELATGEAWRASRAPLPAPDLPSSSQAPGDLQAIAEQLTEYWRSQPPVRVLARYGESLDVTGPEGRWQLLALAVLLAAPVPWARVEETFCALRRKGLLEVGDVARATVSWQQEVDHVLARSYRGPVRRDHQRQRLTVAASTVCLEWGGDPGVVWEKAGQRPEATVRLLRQSLDGIDRMASWIVREMGRLGVWADAHRHVAAFYPDPYLRRAVHNLGLGDGRARPPVLKALVIRHFGGDSTILSSQGRALCGAGSIGTCLSRCPVARYCRAWTGWRDTGQEAEGRATGS
ncbi:hypothetical protein U7230_11085 [Carboxydochorda subterranea]|uniref:Uncharacterized protein n=1 Tax=Carboxydichorda subterranea TaxID=3109565 RepID=A0ABZ1BUZ7_9FIRM|nr:hypothetical protein [Limnochorda sp. L945t]WRP16631.1 hypothetical protein U7230_11085 [Limnochorda sp. L945t]